MLTQKEIEEVINSSVSIVDFCKDKNISKRTFYNYMNKYGIKKSKNEMAKNKIKSSIGTRFNRWTVIEYIGDNKTSNGLVKCKCDCGTELDVRYYDLVSGQTKGCNSCSKIERSKNCGKYERKIGKENWKFNGYEKISGHYWSVVKSRAKKRGNELSISIEYAYQILEKQNFKCAISRLDIYLPKSDNKKWTATLDRIDSTKGYIENNVQWLHKDINTMKWAFTQDQFLNYCRIIVENNKVDDEQ
jgi:hypothetical protein